MIPESKSFAAAWQRAQPRPPEDGSRDSKKNFAERFTRGLAEQLTADLRVHLGAEVRTASEVGRSPGERGATGLDVVYGNPMSGLGLGISLKSVTFADGQTGRFTKNFKRIDHELRSEAIDHHERQPFAVLVALLFLPIESAKDGSRAQDLPSSFGRAIERFRPRIGRTHPHGDLGRFERMFVALYEVAGPSPRVGFFDALTAPPKRGVPTLLNWESMLAKVLSAYQERQAGSSFVWQNDVEDDESA